MNNQDDPFFSVILPVYNGARYLKECVDCVLAQSYPHWELMIVDDASTDATPEIIRGSVNRDSRVRALRNEKNIKSGPSTNRGIKECHGSWICRVDGDDRYRPIFLERLFQSIRQHGQSADCFFTSYVKIIDENGRSVMEITLPDSKKVKQMIWAENVICQSATCYPKALWKKVGGYPSVQSEPDDRALWKRFVKAHAELIMIPEILVDYRIHFTNITFSVDSGKDSSEISGIEAVIKNKEWKIPIFLRQRMLKEARLEMKGLFKLQNRKTAKQRLYYLLTFLPSNLVYWIMWEIRPRILRVMKMAR